MEDVILGMDVDQGYHHFVLELELELLLLWLSRDKK